MEILIIDDDKECCDALETGINKLLECRIHKAYHAMDSLSILGVNSIDLIFSDVNMPDLSGIELVQILKNSNRNTDVVLISGVADIIQSLNSIETGAVDFITKPVDILKIREIIEFCMKKKNGSEERNQQAGADFTSLADTDVLPVDSCYTVKQPAACRTGRTDTGFYLCLPSISNILNKLQKLWQFNEIPILIQGKTGTGKEVIAKYIHDRDTGKGKPFAAINCATMTRELFASELFGYEKGAFTGANAGGSDGFLKMAEGGTIFFDEITEIPLEMQTQLLRVLQEGEYYKVGGRQRQLVNTRIIFATNRDIEELVKKGFFREDLYFRINVCKIELPPLAGHKEDILPLVMHFIRQLNQRSEQKILGVEAGSIRVLQQYAWPGNIRELKNCIIKSVLFCKDEILRSGDIVLLPGDETPARTHAVINPYRFLLPPEAFSLEMYIQRIVSQTLRKFDGNKSQAAKFLSLTRMQLYNKYKVDRYEDQPGQEELIGGTEV